MYKISIHKLFLSYMKRNKQSPSEGEWEILDETFFNFILFLSFLTLFQQHFF
uniref:Uncharacterized protein n=1 Tax=Oryza brachyantha TaxID=4533 RepID=J3MSX3_ORYBR